MKKTLILLGLVLSSFTSHATLISHNGYTLDETTNIVSDGNLEWLRWDQTLNVSINNALEDAATGTIASLYGIGWRIATNLEMSSLLNHFNVTNLTFDADENTNQQTSNINEANILAFGDLFGRTYSHYAGNPGSTMPLGDSYLAAYFGSDADNDGRVNYVELLNDYTFRTGSYVNQGRVRMTKDDSSPNFYVSHRGVALVRDGNFQNTSFALSSNQPSTLSVPEPTSLVLFILSLIIFCRKWI